MVVSYLKPLMPRSLRSRLTLGVALLSMIGLGSVVVWISWRMQRLLIVTHKQTSAYIVERFPDDARIYGQMSSPQDGIQQAIDNLTDGSTLLWVKNAQRNIIAESMPMRHTPSEQALMSLKNISTLPEPRLLNGRYWLMCGTPLVIDGQNFGTLFVAQDITDDQTLFLQLIRSLGLVSLTVILLMAIALAWYIKRALLPLKKMEQITEAIAVEDIGAAKLQLESAPLEVQQLAATFEALLSRLAMTLDRQQQLVSDVSHELRTPLTIISGYLQSTLRRGDNLTSPQREALTIAEDETHRTAQLLQDLLDLARADSGYMRFQCDPLELGAFLTELVNISRHASPRQIHYQPPSQPCWIDGDRNRLKQIFLNLIDNALKYSPVETEVNVQLSIEDRYAIVKVCDHGYGIPLAQQSRIFERFYRVDESRNRRGGTGLGLAIVKTLVEGMGGIISLTSQVEQGSTFQVSFPLLRRTSPAHPVETESRPIHAMAKQTPKTPAA
ncbi:MAG: sensor histidine kinase [Synechocystis sp.]